MRNLVASFFIVLLIVACGDDENSSEATGVQDSDVSNDAEMQDSDPTGEPCVEEDAVVCHGNIVSACANGVWSKVTDCAANTMRCEKPTSGPAYCVQIVCGDGVLDTITGEECDDGNKSGNDGCTKDCLEERIETVMHWKIQNTFSYDITVAFCNVDYDGNNSPHYPLFAENTFTWEYKCIKGNEICLGVKKDYDESQYFCGVNCTRSCEDEYCFPCDENTVEVLLEYGSLVDY